MSRHEDDAWSQPQEPDPHADDEPVELTEREETRQAMRRAQRSARTA